MYASHASVVTFLKAHSALVLSVALFIGFGLVQLAQFETTDEHFWKYDRVPSYFTGWQTGLTTGNWQNTRINDKPGITVALLSGIGLPFTGDPDAHRDRQRDALYPSPETKKDGTAKPLHTFYHTEQTTFLNTALRLPILLFAGLVALPLIYSLILQVFSRRSAGVATVLIASNAILIGISRIVNPDAILWFTSMIAILAFLALLKTQQKKYLLVSGLFLGFALLSKYTANVLFIMLPLLWAFYTHVHSRERLTIRAYSTYVRNIGLITTLSFLIFLAFLPAAAQNPHHFLYGTTYSPVLRPLVDGVISLTHTSAFFFTEGSTYQTRPVLLLSFVLLGILLFIIPLIARILLTTLPRVMHWVLSIPTVLFLAIISLSLVNAWTGTPLFSLTDLKEVSREGGIVSFSQFAQDPTLIYWLKVLTVQAQNVIFSLHPLILCGVIIALVLSLTKRPWRYTWLVWFVVLFIFLFLIGGTFANVFVNTRYSIVLYPLILLLVALAYEHLLSGVHVTKRVVLYGIGVIFLVTSLWQTKPFYFNYTSALLPQEYFVSDAWGLGLYEAAQYLNDLPDAENTVIWADHNGIRQWFVGRTITTSKVYLDYTDIHYVVLTRRGSLTSQPSPRTDDLTKKDISFRQFYTDDAVPVWELQLLDRPENFIRIYKVQ